MSSAQLRFALSVLMALAVIALLALKLGVVSWPSSAKSPTSGARKPTAAQATTAAQSTAQAYATAQTVATTSAVEVANRTEGATLGGLYAAIATGYGEPTTLATYNASWANVMVAGQSTNFTVLFNQPINSGGLGITVITYPAAPGAQWTLQTAQTVGDAFMPNDAQHLQDSTTSQGIDLVFRSAQLAAALSPAYFVDSHGQHVAPGTFTMQCATPAGGSASCLLKTGR